MMIYDPADHYWVVAGNRHELWSSALPGYVLAEDKVFHAWMSAGGWATIIASEAELDEVLATAGYADRGPNPPKRMVTKSVIVGRLIATGKIVAAKAALDANPAAFARWFASDRPAINFDDPDALLLLQAIGADAAVILAEDTK